MPISLGWLARKAQGSSSPQVTGVYHYICLSYHMRVRDWTEGSLGSHGLHYPHGAPISPFPLNCLAFKEEIDIFFKELLETRCFVVVLFCFLVGWLIGWCFWNLDTGVTCWALTRKSGLGCIWMENERKASSSCWTTMLTYKGKARLCVHSNPRSYGVNLWSGQLREKRHRSYVMLQNSGKLDSPSPSRPCSPLPLDDWYPQLEAPCLSAFLAWDGIAH